MAAKQTITTLEGILAICAKCKKIRDEQQHWVPLETYMHEHADVNFTPGLCPACAQTYLAEVDRLLKRR